MRFWVNELLQIKWSCILRRPKPLQLGDAGIGDKSLIPLSFVLPDRVAVLQNGNGVGLRTFFTAADCDGVPANCTRCYAVLCASWNSSGCDFLSVIRSGADRRNLFLEIRGDALAAHCRAAFLLFAALVQHARRPGRVRGGQGESPW